MSVTKTNRSIVAVLHAPIEADEALKQWRKTGWSSRCLVGDEVVPCDCT
jgi:hypothetical protein